MKQNWAENRQSLSGEIWDFFLGVFPDNTEIVDVNRLNCCVC